MKKRAGGLRWNSMTRALATLANPRNLRGFLDAFKAAPAPEVASVHSASHLLHFGMRKSASNRESAAEYTSASLTHCEDFA